MHIDQDTGKPFCLFPTKELEADLRAYHERACVHAETRLTKVVVKNGMVQYRRQCLHCGELQGTPVKHSEVPDNVPPKDEALVLRYNSNRDDELQNIYQKHIRKQKARDTEWWDRYHRHMKSPEWAVLRTKVLKRAGGICEGCADRPAVQVHHLTYDNMGNEFLFELVAVCMECHERLHIDEELDEGTSDEDAEAPAT